MAQKKKPNEITELKTPGIINDFKDQRSGKVVLRVFSWSPLSDGDHSKVNEVLSGLFLRMRPEGIALFAMESPHSSLNLNSLRRALNRAFVK
jgi:hypothetical protein